MGTLSKSDLKKINQWKRNSTSENTPPVEEINQAVIESIPENNNSISEITKEVIEKEEILPEKELAINNKTIFLELSLNYAG